MNYLHAPFIEKISKEKGFAGPLHDVIVGYGEFSIAFFSLHCKMMNRSKKSIDMVLYLRMNGLMSFVKDREEMNE